MKLKCYFHNKNCLKRTTNLSLENEIETKGLFFYFCNLRIFITYIIFFLNPK